MKEERKNSVSHGAANRSLRVALFASEHTMYEYATLLKHLLVGLADESVPVALVCPPNCEVEGAGLPSVEVVRYPALELPLVGPWNRRVLFERLSQFKPTVLHCLCESHALLTRRLSRRLSLPYVLSINSLQKRFGQPSVSLRRLAKIIVPTKSIESNIREVCPRLAGRVEQINVGTFARETIACFGNSGRLASVVVAVPLVDNGELESLFNAVRHLAIEGQEFMLVVIAGGEGEKRLRKLVYATGLSQVVVMVPRVEPWRAVLSAGDIFVQPAASNAFSPLLLEAMSVGAAVVGCKGGVDDLIIADETAVVFDAADELSMYNSLKRLFDRPEFARAIASKAQQYLKENHTVSNMVAGYLRNYREAQGWLKR